MLVAFKGLVSRHAGVSMGVLALTVLLLSYWPIAYLEGQVPILLNDSPGYIGFSAMRTAGYPTVIILSRLLGAGLTGVIVAQVAVFAMAVGYLASSLSRHVGAHIVTGVSALIVLNPFIVYHFAIMSDSLTYSLLIIIIGLSIDILLEKQKSRCLAVLSLCIGLAISLRPASWGFVIVIPMLMMHLKRQGGASLFKGLCAALIPLLVVTSASEAISYLLHGREKSSPATYHFYAKSFLVSSGAAPNGLDPAAQNLWTIAETQGEGLRQILDRCPSEKIRAATMLRIERALVWDYVAPVILPDVRRRVAGSGTNGHSLVVEVGLRRILANPMQFLRLTWDDYLMLWKPYSERALSPEIDPYLQSITITSPVGHKFAQMPETGIVRNHAINSSIPRSRSVHAGFEVVWIILGLTAGGLLLGPITYMSLAVRTRQSDPTLLVASILGITVHGCLLLDALTAPAEGRYLLLLVPMIVISVAFFGTQFYKVLDWCRGREPLLT